MNFLSNLINWFTGSSVGKGKSYNHDSLLNDREGMAEAFKDEFPIDLNKGCPDCGHTKFNMGPEGGICVNIRCANEKCHSEFNMNQMTNFAHRINTKLRLHKSAGNE